MILSQRKSYSELILLPSFEERFEYLKIDGIVGQETFGYDRYLNQMLYTSKRWRMLRNDLIIRDRARDLGVEGYDISYKLTLHHINPITKEDILREDPSVFDPENLICCSYKTHKAIHFINDGYIPYQFAEREPNDTCPWRKR